MRKFILGIIGSILILSGCANRDLAKHYLQEGKVQKAYAIYKRWEKIGEPRAALDLAKIESNENKKINYAYKAYKKGNRYAANILEKIFYNKGDLKKARSWYEKADLNNSNQSDFYVHLAVILTYPTIKKQQYEIQKIENLTKYNNVFAANALGKFYENENNYFYNLQKSEYFYELAYKKGYIPSGLNLGILYLYKFNKEKKGLDILRKIAPKDNGRAAYVIAKYLLHNLNYKIIKLNTPCVTCSFKTPYQFFSKKYYLIKYRDEFIKKNIVAWLNYSCKKGYIPAKFELISLDIQYDKFLTDDTYSGLSLKKAINFLNNFKDKFFKTKMLLADIYYKYDFLKMYPLSKQIYYEYANYNKLDAYWHLYQYYKKYEPASNKKGYYLNYLAEHNFVPGIIEKKYSDILKNRNIEKSKNVLYSYAKQNNILALKYYVSIISKEDIPFKKKCYWYGKVCKYTPFDKTTDLKIAKLYELQNNTLKAATIYKFYADFNDSVAAYRLSLIYKKLCNFDKFIYYLKKAEKNGNENIKVLYSMLVLDGKIKDSKKNSFYFIKQMAKKNNLKAVSFLGYLYSTGLYGELDPQKAEFYYRKAIDLGRATDIYLLINLYRKINLNHKFDKKIISLYNEAIKYKLPQAEINLANFYVNIEKYKKAIRLLKKNINNPKAKYLLYQLTGKDFYLHTAIKTNYGRLLLAYAKKIGKSNPYKALLYSFRASLCNTKGAVLYSYEIMKRIDNPEIVRKIYKKAKKYPVCENY